jgi:hypothetical protein
VVNISTSTFHIFGQHPVQLIKKTYSKFCKVLKINIINVVDYKQVSRLNFNEKNEEDKKLILVMNLGLAKKK